MDYAEINVDHKFHPHIIGKNGSNGMLNDKHIIENCADLISTWFFMETQLLYQ